MVTAPDTSLSHRQDIIAQLVRNDPDKADLLFEILSLTDTSTPEGTAAHLQDLHECYVLTNECMERCQQREEQIKTGYQSQTYHGLAIESDA